MNARLISAIEELEASQIVDEMGYEHGFLIEEVREDSRYFGEYFYRTLAEAKRAFIEIELASEHDRVYLYEGEFRFDHEQLDDRIEARWVTLVDERCASVKEVAWFQAEYDYWVARSQEYTAAYWHVRDWLTGRIPAPVWA